MLVVFACTTYPSTDTENSFPEMKIVPEHAHERQWRSEADEPSKSRPFQVAAYLYGRSMHG
jgi:hypothetical protein